MTESYTILDKLSSGIFVLVLFGLCILAACIYVKRTEKKYGTCYACYACKNRGGKYPPKTCRKYSCKYRAL